MLPKKVVRIMLCRGMNPQLRRFCSERSDKELQLSYGIWQRLLSLQQLFSEEGRQSFMKLHTQGVLPYQYMIEGLPLYTDLQSPLLKKYKFDVADFSRGVREAFLQVHRAIASEDFFNFVNGNTTTSDANELLSVSLHPRLYKACRDAMGRDEVKKNLKFHMIDNKIISMAVVRVRTKVVEKVKRKGVDDYKKYDRKDILKKMSGNSKVIPVDMVSGKIKTQVIDDAKKEKTENNEETEDQEKGNEAIPKSADTMKAEATPNQSFIDTENLQVLNELIAPPASIQGSSTLSAGATEGPATRSANRLMYPVGSVVATVDVMFESEERYEMSNGIVDADEGGDERATAKGVVEEMIRNSSIVSERRSVSHWTFRACISGHVDVDWYIVGFDGYGAI